MSDRDVLRALAGRLRELAERDAMPALRQRWIDHNALRDAQPLIVCFPEGAWTEIYPTFETQCEDPVHRQWERRLRSRLYEIEQIGDDQPAEPCFNIGWQVHKGDFGVKIPQTHGDNRGSYIWDPPLKNLPADMDKLHFRELSVDRPATQALVERADAMFGDLLHVRIRGGLFWSVGMTWDVVNLIGLEQLMLLMFDQPDDLHRLMGFMRDEMTHVMDWAEREGLLTAQNEGDYAGSGGLAYSDELAGGEGPKKLADRWGFAESQETVGISPAMFDEFVLPYQLPMLERFGLNYYGCCEPLDHRIDSILKQVPRLRRVSVAPHADQALMAEKLGGRYVFCRKADPVPVCVDFNEQTIRADVRKTLAAAWGQPLEIILKDTHTVQNQPERLGRWVRIVREEIAARGG